MRWNSLKKMIAPLAYLIVIGLIAAAAWFGRPYWQPLVGQTEAPDSHSHDHVSHAPADKPKILELSAKARANLSLMAAPAKPQVYWRKLQIPGVIEDRPGLTDRGITTPLAGVITQVHAFEGDIVRPGEKLFTIRLASEYLQQSQSDLFKAKREIEILDTEMQRISRLIETGAVPGKRKIALEQQISRQNANVDAYRQDLTARGVTQQQVDQIERGEFLTEIAVAAPTVKEANDDLEIEDPQHSDAIAKEQHFFEIQKLSVELGQQVQAGSALAVLANHNSLYIKGHAFKKEASRLAKAAKNNWEMEVEFTEDVAEDWDAREQTFQIRHLANTTNPNSRTFDFFIPLENQSISYQKEGRPFVVWRYRPGQRVNVLVPVEEIKNVLVLPAEAVVFEGPEAYVFQQNGDLFNRIAVEVAHRDRHNVVLVNDGSISPGFYIAQNAAASLNRVLKSQAAGGLQPGFHMHADGTIHGAH